MAVRTPKNKKRRKFRKFGDRGRCRFCRHEEELDYKNVGTLQKLCTQQGKLFSRKRSGNCAKHQRLFKRHVKYARFLALMPYVG
ncbi:MAG: 30S ribosomal protein S18 [Planctomycetota bacterium]